MPLSELVRVRAEDLEPGRRVRVDRQLGLVTVADVTIDDNGTCLVSTDAGVYVCGPHDLLDAEDAPASVRGPL